MRNKYNGIALTFKVNKLLKEFACLLSCQNCGRLVQNQNFGTTNQSL
ncbi:hypothetical protein EVA_09831 [gut metagenome]|uniref:Uncharacterized protein n=1 Tax=gut metagenome TaxID=749906 RepID=J9CPN6_9ZZZZ